MELKKEFLRIDKSTKGRQLPPSFKQKYSIQMLFEMFKANQPSMKSI